MTPGWLATAPLRWWARRFPRPQRSLPRPAVSVGNLALGGRGKTPTAAALARALAEVGFRPGLLSGGYRGQLRGSSDPVVVLRGQPSPLPAWDTLLQGDGRVLPAWQWRRRCGDEAPWLAASCPGIPVAVHRDRLRAASALPSAVDLLVLDDGFQASVASDVHVVLVHRELDLGRGAAREGPGALDRADLVVSVGTTPTPDAGLHLLKAPGALTDLDGHVVAPCPVRVAAGVGDQRSVVVLAERAGCRVLGVQPSLDHARPLLRRGDVPWLITAKDAVGWARRRPPRGAIVVLHLDLLGLPAVTAAVLDALDTAGIRPRSTAEPPPGHRRSC